MMIRRRTTTTGLSSFPCHAMNCIIMLMLVILSSMVVATVASFVPLIIRPSGDHYTNSHQQQQAFFIGDRRDQLQYAATTTNGDRGVTFTPTARFMSTMKDPLIATAAAAIAAAAAATVSSSTTTTTPYPTARGSQVDSRKIIATGVGRQHLVAVRMQHILFATHEMAQSCLHLLRNTGSGAGGASGDHYASSSSSTIVSFEDLARKLSACEATRDQGGEIGWVSVVPPKQQQQQSDLHDTTAMEEDTLDEHLNHILPQQARQQVLQITTKPGDVVSIQSSRGYHLVQIVDIMANVRKMATMTRLRKNAGNNTSTLLLQQSTPENKYQGLTYQLETMGCQMNMADSERIEGQLQSLGIRPLESFDDDSDDNIIITSGSQKRKKKKNRPFPDVVVLNTCSIRDHAEQKVYSHLGSHVKRKRDGHDVTIIVAGCVAQQQGKRLLQRIPEIDLVMGPQYANRLGDLLEDVANGNQVVATEATHIMEDSTKPRRQSTVCAWVNVIYGCNERCTFCIVPTTRGVEQSRPVESIIKEIQELVQQQGYKEITLLGQNIDAFGRDQIPKRKFSDLIRMVGNIPGLQRLRFVTSHPRYMSLGVVDSVAETPTACESFHIPFQSGSNEILIAMGRGHTREKYLHIVNRIRTRIPDASITADAIVGFPGETEEQFQDTLSLMEEVVFDSVNTAAYSPRPNTPAGSWDNQIPDDVKQDRLQRINALNKQHATQRRARMLGRTVEILVEERNTKSGNLAPQVVGRTRHGYIVYCPGDIEELRGKLVNVKIETTQTYYLTGQIVD